MKTSQEEKKQRTGSSSRAAKRLLAGAMAVVLSVTLILCEVPRLSIQARAEGEESSFFQEDSGADSSAPGEDSLLEESSEESSDNSSEESSEESSDNSSDNSSEESTGESSESSSEESSGESSEESSTEPPAPTHPGEIPADWYEIESVTATYDGQEHALSVKDKSPDDHTLTFAFSTDGTLYGDKIPSRVTVGKTGPIHVRITDKINRNGQADFQDYSLSSTYSIEITKATRGSFAYTSAQIHEGIRVTYPVVTADASVSGVTDLVRDGASVQYSILTPDHEQIASIDPSTGLVTFHKAGRVTVQAFLPATSNYEEKAVKVVVECGKASLSAAEFSFSDPAPHATFDDLENGQFYEQTVTAPDWVRNQKTITITYEILESHPAEGAPSGAAMAKIEDPDKGKIKVQYAGNVTVQATASGDWLSQPYSCQYTLTVDPKTQSALTFADGTTEKTIDVEYLSFFNVPDIIGGDGSGALSYTVQDAGQIVSFASDYSHGQVVNVGQDVVLTAQKHADGVYSASSQVTFTIHPTPASQTGKFKFESAHYLFSINDDTCIVKAVGGDPDYSDVTYSIDEADKNYASVVPAGDHAAKVVFAEGVYRAVTVHATRPGNACYAAVDTTATVSRNGVQITGIERKEGQDPVLAGPATLTFNIVQSGFDASKVHLKVTAHDAHGNEIILPADQYEQDLQSRSWDRVSEDGELYQTTMTFEEEGIYSLTIYYDTESMKDALNFTVDKSSPYQFSFTYNEMDLINKIKEFFFGTGKIKVTIEVTDDFSEITAISYRTDSDGAYTEYVGRNTGEDIKNLGSGVYQTSFEIEPQYCGYVTCEALDAAGRKGSASDSSTRIVSDSIAPVLAMTPDPAHAVNGNFYSGKATVQITVTEKNFSTVHFEIKAQRKAPDAAEWEDYPLSLDPGTFKDLGNDVHQGTAEFTQDGEYKISVKCVDGARHESNGQDVSFIVDSLKPKIALSYDNNAAQNENCFQAGRTLTITITDQNFHPESVSVIVTARTAPDQNGQTADVALGEDVTARLRQRASWKVSGDVCTASVVFDKDAHYTISVSCLDKAGNPNETPTYPQETKAVYDFIVDTTAPKGQIRFSTKTWHQEWMDFPDAAHDERSYSLLDNQAVTVYLQGDDELSGISRLEYLKTSALLSLEQVRQEQTAGHFVSAQLTEVDPAQPYTNLPRGEGEPAPADKKCTSFVVDPDGGEDQFYLYLHVVDRSGNEVYISSDGLIVDQTSPTAIHGGSMLQVDSSGRSAAGLYRTDVPVYVSVSDESDTGIRTGIRSVTYLVYNNRLPEGQRVTQSGTLFDAARDANGRVIHTLSSTGKNGEDFQMQRILVDSSLNNGDDIEVVVTTTDNARNTTTVRQTLSIDTAEPAITVSFDNNEVLDGLYFTKTRTATITVRERHFDPALLSVHASGAYDQSVNVSSFSRAGGYGDDTAWTATVTFPADGDYTFSVSAEDEAGNPSGDMRFASGTAAGSHFIIDTKAPVIQVAFDKNNSRGELYYPSDRTMTVTVAERNLTQTSLQGVRVTYVDLQGHESYQTLTGWQSDGQVSTASLTLSEDGYYIVSASMTDAAGHNSEPFAPISFYIDQTQPVIQIRDVADESANNGQVAPVIEFSDENFDKDKVQIRLTGALCGEVTPSGTFVETDKGEQFLFNDFPHEEGTDDIYTLEATMTDKAGNTVTSRIHFSVNRFGSTYGLDETSSHLNGTYVTKAGDVLIDETNVDSLHGIVITLYHDGEATILQEGRDFEISVSRGAGGWHHYQYRIFSANFRTDGVYTLTVQSEDAAGNTSQNDLDTKGLEVSFGVDNVLPIVHIENLESHTTYAMENMTVNISAKDNLHLAKVFVELDGQVYRTWEGRELEEAVTGGGSFTVDIPGTSDKPHRLTVYAVDSAGNGAKVSGTDLPENAESVEDFYVTTNLWVRFINNTTAIAIAAAAVVLAFFFIILAVLRRSEKEEAAEEAAVETAISGRVGAHVSGKISGRTSGKTSDKPAGGPSRNPR